MLDRERNFTDLGWLEIAHVFAELVGAHVVVYYGSGYSCSVDYHYTSPDGREACTGLTEFMASAEESAELLMRRVFKYAPQLRFPGIALPEIDFESKDDLVW